MCEYGHKGFRGVLAFVVIVFDSYIGTKENINSSHPLGKELEVSMCVSRYKEFTFLF